MKSSAFRRVKGTYGKPDRFYESMNYDSSVWTFYWLAVAYDDRYDAYRDTPEEVHRLKCEIFLDSWEEMNKVRAGSGWSENVAEAL